MRLVVFFKSWIYENKARCPPPPSSSSPVFLQFTFCLLPRLEMSFVPIVSSQQMALLQFNATNLGKVWSYQYHLNAKEEQLTSRQDMASPPHKMYNLCVSWPQNKRLFWCSNWCFSIHSIQSFHLQWVLCREHCYRRVCQKYFYKKS